MAGYVGGTTIYPTYQDVCYKDTGHAEGVLVTFDCTKTSYEELGKQFFQIHDPTTLNRQGNDYGSQYRSEIFYYNDDEKNIYSQLINILQNKGYNVVTKLTFINGHKFWPAEQYHQHYYSLSGSSLFNCHFFTKRFD